ncbi:hypothetical protein HQ585_16835 [candidate division KSB1 bacterium]|nr:hypothetical protein [candidate division KSB1 bacterium]
MSSLSREIIEKAESFPGIKAGIACLEDILKAPSYQAVPSGEWRSTLLDTEVNLTEWPPEAHSVVVLGMHPTQRKTLDWTGGMAAIQ